MTTADETSRNLYQRLIDVNAVISNGNHCFKINMSNPGSFPYRGDVYDLIKLKKELDSYGKERELINQLMNFYEETLQ